MADFDLRHSPYIALVRRADVETTPDDPVRAAIYAPGTVCAFCTDHEHAAAFTSYALLLLMALLSPARAGGRLPALEDTERPSAVIHHVPLVGPIMGHVQRQMMMAT
jgi:hypothetical protein